MKSYVKRLLSGLMVLAALSVPGMALASEKGAYTTEMDPRVSFVLDGNGGFQAKQKMPDGSERVVVEGGYEIEGGVLRMTNNGESGHKVETLEFSYDAGAGSFTRNESGQVITFQRN